MFAHRLDEQSELRLLEARHAEAMFRVIDANRAHLAPWMTWVDATREPADVHVYIEGTLRRFAANNGFDCGIWHRGELVGSIGLHAIEWTHRWSSLGYWLARDAQRHGLVTAAVRALLGHAFDELGLHRMEIRCEPANRRSRAIPERLGFTQEGTLRQVQRIGERWTDLVVYSLLAPEWGAGRG